MSNGYDEVTSRREKVVEIRLAGGTRIKRARILTDISIDDLMMNALRAEAMRVKTGFCEAPVFKPDMLDYLLRG